MPPNTTTTTVERTHLPHTALTEPASVLDQDHVAVAASAYNAIADRYAQFAKRAAESEPFARSQARTWRAPGRIRHSIGPSR
ncbi:hypothetical protein ACIRRA_08785 [Nocardia sp. NPDC101769]|uniref:hypothetical protein n=1 Tax=Nocardia sp. NPDC101769 TaxID=3364333 RepID=UPI003806FF2F